MRFPSSVGSTHYRAGASLLGMAAAVGLATIASGCLDRELKPLNPCLVSGVVNQISVQNVDKVDLLFVVDNSGSMREEQASLRTQFPRMIRSLTRGERYDANGMVVGNFAPVRDLHLGVVTTDMGLPGVPGRMQVNCGDDATRLFGDDGVLRNLPNPGGAAGLSCAPGYPIFLRFVYDPANEAGSMAAAEQIANDFSCISSLGTMGCGFEMQLESMLRALWPSNNVLLDGSSPPAFADGKPFMANGGSMFGQGNPSGPNAGFLRDDPAQGLSLIGVVIVSDEEDCSSWKFDHFTSSSLLPDGDPLKNIGLNLRCWHQSTIAGEDSRDRGERNLFGTTRYAQALKALRPGQENLVVFAGIVGVPTTLINPNVDLTDANQRNAYYDSLLANPQLAEQPDPATMGGMGTQPNVIPSCVRGVDDPNTMENETQRAFPPRRFIKVAKEFGENATIQSICSDDFTPAVDQIIQIIARQLGAVCLPRQLTRDAEGTVDCDVVWDLPPPNLAQAGTPRSCVEAPYLKSPPSNRRQTNDRGGAICVVDQVRVVDCTGTPADGCFNGKQAFATPGQIDPVTGAPIPVEGWYYDNFTDEVNSCTGADKQRIAFRFAAGSTITDAAPPSGVTVRLECLQEAASVTAPRNDVNENQTNPMRPDNKNPGPGSECSGDAQCQVVLSLPDDCIAGRPYRSAFAPGVPCYDTQMFCHPDFQVCMTRCNNKSECLPGFECDDRPDTRAPTAQQDPNVPPPYPEAPQGLSICVNPTCGD